MTESTTWWEATFEFADDRSDEIGAILIESGALGVQTISDAPSDGAFLHAGTSKFITGAGHCKWHADSRRKGATCEELVQELQELQASKADPAVDGAVESPGRPP